MTNFNLKKGIEIEISFRCSKRAKERNIIWSKIADESSTQSKAAPQLPKRTRCFTLDVPNEKGIIYVNQQKNFHVTIDVLLEPYQN